MPSLLFRVQEATVDHADNQALCGGDRSKLGHWARHSARAYPGISRADPEKKSFDGLLLDVLHQRLARQLLPHGFDNTSGCMDLEEEGVWPHRLCSALYQSTCF